jgi:hypothetical protein
MRGHALGDRGLASPPAGDGNRPRMEAEPTIRAFLPPFFFLSTTRHCSYDRMTKTSSNLFCFEMPPRSNRAHILATSLHMRQFGSPYCFAHWINDGFYSLSAFSQCSVVPSRPLSTRCDKEPPGLPLIPGQRQGSWWR